MDFSGSKYYKPNRLLLLSIGLWPYEKSIFKQVKILISFGFMITYDAAMIAKIFTSEYDILFILKTLSMIMPYSIFTFKYITFLLFPTSIKELMEWVQNDWNSLKDINELEIIRKYSNFARFLTVTFTVMGNLNTFHILLYIYLLDFVVPRNFSRARKLPVDVEYFIDEQKYSYVIVCHVYIAALFSMIALIATESLYISYVIHAGAMFKITSFRLQHAYNQDLSRISPFKRNAVIHTKIVAAIEIHKRSLKFHDFLWSRFATSYFIVLLIGMTSVTINLFRVFRATVAIKSTEELILSFGNIFSHFVYMFCICYTGQILKDHSTRIREDACDTHWYRVPVQQQKLFSVILHRSLNSCKLIIGGIVVLSLEGFASLISLAISYFTVLLSVQS